MSKPKTWVCLFDIHYPKYSKSTFNAAMEFIRDVNPAGVLLGGDQLDNEEISHHNRNKPLYRQRASYKRNTEGFNNNVLKPIEQAIGKAAERVWIVGNHCDWERQLIEEQPELEGIIERPELLKLAERGWKVVPLGHAFKLGELNIIHGEILTGIGNQAGACPAKKALELYGSNVLAGHTHAPQSFSKISPVEAKKKYMAWISPIIGDTNPAYLRNRPTAWLNGFTIVELRDKGMFNLYPVIIVDGKFTYGGKEYSGR